MVEPSPSACARKDGSSYRKWDNFKKAILSNFQSPDEGKRSLEKLRELRQTCTVCDYTYEFRNLVREVPSFTDAQLCVFYIHGLKPNVGRDTDAQCPTTLDGAIRVAERLDLYDTNRKSVQQRSYNGNSDNTNNTNSTTPGDTSSTAMDLDAVATTERSKRGIKCYYCQKMGHYTKECRKKVVDEKVKASKN